MTAQWTRDSWRAKPIQQAPNYPNLEALNDVERVARCRFLDPPGEGRREPDDGVDQVRVETHLTENTEQQREAMPEREAAHVDENVSLVV